MIATSCVCQRAGGLYLCEMCHSAMHPGCPHSLLGPKQHSSRHTSSRGAHLASCHVCAWCDLPRATLLCPLCVISQEGAPQTMYCSSFCGIIAHFVVYGKMTWPLFTTVTPSYAEIYIDSGIFKADVFGRSHDIYFSISCIFLLYKWESPVFSKN